MMVLKRLLLVVCFLFILIAGFIVLRFGSALSQEGNPLPLLTSIYKLEFSGRDYMQFSSLENGKRYVSDNTGASRFDAAKKMMENYGWKFKEQMGSGLIFTKGEQTTVVETRQYSKHYILWDIPEDAGL